MRTPVVVLLVAILTGACAPVEPSPVPAVSSSPVQAAPNPDLVEFESRVAHARTRLGQLVRSLGEASAGSQHELRLVAGRLGDFATEEAEWLDAHAAAQCYADAVDAYRDGLASIGGAAAAFTDLAAASPPADAEGQAAGQSLADGSTALERAAALAREARADCR
jgi:hypothetical protein